MRRVYLEDLQPGMIIARTIIGRDGRSLLTENTRLTENYISKLDKLGITSIYIKDGLADNEIPEIISQKVLSQVSNNLNLSIKSLTTRNVLQIDSLKKSVSLLIEDIMSNQHLLIQLEDIHSSDDYLFFHSINVAVFSIMIGITLGYTESKLMDIGLGALMHDIGMVMIDQGILKKPGPLDPKELEQLKEHPEIGFNILRTYREVSTMSAHIAYQHHERISGTGYPRQLEGRQIIEFAKVVAVADTFDAVISDRPYRKGYSNAEAVTVLEKLANDYFDPEVVEAMVSNVAVYPVGSILALNTGQLAVVTGVTRSNRERPLIHIITDDKGYLINNPIKVDLKMTDKIVIKRRLSQEEVAQFKTNMQSRSLLGINAK